MASILEGELAETIGQALLDANIPLDVTVTRTETTGEDPFDPGSGTTTTTDYDCKGFADTYGVGARYEEMLQRGELRTMGDKTVPIADFMVDALRQVDGEQISAIVADRFKQSELAEGLDRAQIRAPVIWRGFGWRDGSEDIERFRRAVFDGKVRANPSLLLRSAFADAVTLVDPAGNAKLAKGRALGRIDSAAASVIAVAEGMRQVGRPAKPARAAIWA